MKKFNGLDCILLVDDDQPTNFIHTMVIKKAGIDAQVKAITSATEALDYLNSRGRYDAQENVSPGIIFLDINMPGMDGWEFLEEYENLSLEKRARVIVVMLTTSTHPNDRLRGTSNKHVLRFLSKPLLPTTVNEIVTSFYEPYN